jgi:hypothetical protein
VTKGEESHEEAPRGTSRGFSGVRCSTVWATRQPKHTTGEGRVNEEAPRGETTSRGFRIRRSDGFQTAQIIFPWGSPFASKGARQGLTHVTATKLPPLGG